MAAAESTIVAIPAAAPKPSLEQFLDALPDEDTQRFTMYRALAHIRESQKIYFEPRIVSIGPYHHGKPHLLAMEKHKGLYLRAFLSRHTITLESCLGVVKALVPRVKNCYFDTTFKFSDDEFAEMLLLDACFILEFMTRQMEDITTFENVSWMMSLIRNDLLMLENQIPFFLLHSLIAHAAARRATASDGLTSENSLLLVLVVYVTNCMVKETGSVAFTDIDHMLHLYHHFTILEPDLSVVDKKPLFLALRKALKSMAVAVTSVTCFRKKKQESMTETRTRTSPSALKIRQIGQLLKDKLVAAGTATITYFLKKKKRPVVDRMPRTIPSATKLEESGVKFMKKDTTNSLDITFKNGVLEIPFLQIADDSTTPMMNAVAFEQSIPWEKRLMSSYVLFFYSLIDTPNDVSILHKAGILESLLAGHEETATIFNQLGYYACVDFDEHYLAGVYKDVNKYCSSRRHQWRAKLMSDYFNGPWAILSFGAAVVLLILTFLQTFFSLYAYFRPPG